MSTVDELQESPRTWEPSRQKALDEVAWQAWRAKGAAQDRRRNVARMKAVKWIFIVGLLALAGLWSYVTPFEVVIKFIVAAGATVLMVQALHTRQYAFAAVFGALVLIYNPVVPVLSFSGEWQRAFVAATAAPFIMSLATASSKAGHND